MRLIDAHTHTHLRGLEDLEAMARAGLSGLVVCAYLPVTPTGTATLTDLFRWLIEVERPRVEGAGMEARVAVGIHPRCIPEGPLDAAVEAIAAALQSGAAVALGEVGLETGSAREREALAAQLELAREARVPVVVHTPRAKKAERLAEVIEVLRQARVEPDRVVLDHLTPELVPAALATGAWAGLTVQPGKLSTGAVAEVLRRHGPNRLLVDSDTAHLASDPLAVVHVARQLAAAHVEPAAVERVVGGNAARLFGFSAGPRAERRAP